MENCNNSRLSVCQFNCFSFNSRSEQVREFMLRNDIDFLAVNELKVSEERSNMLFQSYKNHFNFVTKCRPKRSDSGGGVALIFKKNIVYQELSCFDFLNLELVAVEAETNIGTVAIVAYYNPPSSLLSKTLFLELENKFKNFIVCGDFNAHSTSLGQAKTNRSGRVLEEVLACTNMLILNDDKPTYFSFADSTRSARLDLILASPSVEAANAECIVLEKELLQSDHAPVLALFNLNKNVLRNVENTAQNFNFSLADWPLFKRLLTSLDPPAEVMDDVEGLAAFLHESIIGAAEKSIPLKSKRFFSKVLPKNILEFIKLQNKAFWRWRKTGSPYDKEILEDYKKIIKSEIIKFRSNEWLKFLEFVKTRDRNLVSSSPFWKRINQFRSKPTCNEIPKLVFENVEYKSSEDMANLFGSTLSKTFSDQNDARFDSIHKTTVENFVKEKLDNKNLASVPLFTIGEVKSVLKKIKTRAAPGEDRISNTMLKQLPECCLNLILRLANLTIARSQVPEAWKSARIRMIPKKKMSTNPADFRPISLTSCLGKLVERLIALRINEFLKRNNLIIKQQSGFREHRRTSDNLVFLTQKIKESFIKSKKVCAIFFDISKAFDSVWHNGLIYKLFKIGLPDYLFYWVVDFLRIRSFVVLVNGAESCRYVILGGVPQGATISPLIFCIYINDVPITSIPNTSEGLLFADDLTSLFIYDDARKIEKLLSDYMKEFEDWLSKWRLKAHPNKCSYTIFVGNGRRGTQTELVPTLYGEKLPYEEFPKLLGIFFDPKCCFAKQLEEIKKKVISRLNILKIISHRSWYLDKATLTQIYISLVRSVLDYSFFTKSSLSKANLKTLCAVQNNAIRLIHKLPRDAHTKDLLQVSGLPSLEIRFSELGQKYINSCIDNANPLMKNLFIEYDTLLRNLNGTEMGVEKLLSRPTVLCEFHEPIHKAFLEVEVS